MASKVTAGLAESNDSLPSFLWLVSLVGWLSSDQDLPWALCLTCEYGTTFVFTFTLYHACLTPAVVASSHAPPTEWPKISENTTLYDCVTVNLTLLNFTYLYCWGRYMMWYDVICVSVFVLFNNGVIFVLLFGKTAKLLLSGIWVKETKDSLIPVLCLRKYKM